MKKTAKILTCVAVAAAVAATSAALAACSGEEDVKVLSYNSIECTTQNIESGAYELQRPFNLVYETGSLTDVAKTFLDWMQTDYALEIILEEGYVNSSEPIVQTTSTYTGSIRLSGSTSVYPLMQALSEEYMYLHPDVDITVSSGGSGVGLSDATNGNSDIGMISKELDTEAYPTLECVNLCTDGIALIVNANCPVDNVTTDELVGLFTKGETIQDTISHGIGRDSGSGTRSAFDELLGIEVAYTKGIDELADTGLVISLIQSNTAGDTIGYVSAGSV